MSNNKIIQLRPNETIKDDFKKTIGNESESFSSLVLEQSIEVNMDAIRGEMDILKSTLKVSMKN